MGLVLYNTLTRKKEIFKSIKDKEVKIYACGPTVYNYAHIGNLRTYIFEDILKRVFLWNRYKVKHVMNITDVGHLTSDADTGEDKMEVGAAREHKTAWDIAAFYTKAFKDDLKKLNITKPDALCRATDNIKEQIELIQKLEKKGFTYRTKDGIYFDTSKLKDYGMLSRLHADDFEAGKRVEISEKKNPADFALWKFSPKDSKRQMEWKSPWGAGFPGWHVECSAMSMKYLGETFDVHCGGTDHIPVHHQNEIAQSEAATGKPFVNYWLHGAFLVLEKGKMAKSGGNFVTLQKVIDAGYEPLDYRYFTLTAHYRSQLSFSWEALTSARAAFNILKERYLAFKRDKTKASEKDHFAMIYLSKFTEAINNDLDIPMALSLLWEIIKHKELNDATKYFLVRRFDEVFGLGLKDLKETKTKVPAEIRELAEEREKARKKKDWKRSDELRGKIEQKGYIVEDTSQGHQIRKKR